ncbi:SRPBCC family protein [Oscillatoria amoena NRMC-F 0135]|nr:SRPBCC family protein [Oscillatoria amoena NRMC-F 0135]
MVKKVLLALAGLVVVIVIIGFFLPSKTQVSRSIFISAPSAYIFEEVNDLEKHPEWSYWNNLYKDDMAVTYGTIKTGTGAISEWAGEESGTGKMTITESVPDKSVKMDLDFMDQGTAKSWYTFEPEGEGTRVTTGFEADMGFNPLMRIMAATLMKPEMNKAFDYNLNRLKEIAESKPKFITPITKVTTQPISYVGVSTTMSFEDEAAISAQMGKSFGELMTALGKSKIEMTGPAFCLYPKWDENTRQMEMVCALPVPADAKSAGKFSVMQVPAGNAVKAVHLGDYAKLKTTHDEIARYIEYKKLEINGAPREVYITDPMVEKDIAKWVTEVYYPVKN